MPMLKWLRAATTWSPPTGGTGTRDPRDDWWYTPPGAPNSSGVRVTHASALASTVVYACVKVIAENMGQLPFMVYQREANGDKTRRDDHPVFQLLHTQANEEQTAAEYREQIAAWALLRGTAFSEIVTNASGTAPEQLIPLFPDHVTVRRQVDGQGRVRWVVEYREPGAPMRALTRDQLFVFRGLAGGPDRILGIDPIAAEAQAIGAHLSANDYAGRFFANDARPSALLKSPGTFKTDEDKNRFRRAWEALFTRAGRHRVAVLEKGMEYQAISVTPEQAQFLETRKYQENDIARIFRVPPHKIGILDRATFSNIEHQAIEFVTDTLGPWLNRFEQAAARDLITRSDVFFGEHSVNALLRGDIRARFEAYAVARNWGWLSVNEIRRLENLNGIGRDGDVYLQPLNMEPAGSPGDPSSQGRGQAMSRERAASVIGMRKEGSLWVPN